MLYRCTSLTLLPRTVSLTHSQGHATISQPEERWAENLFNEKFSSPPNSITIDDFKKVTQGLKEQINSDVTKWTFDRLKRDGDGRFPDADLARILQDGTANPAGAFKARGTPAALHIVEVMSILQGRAWGCCTVGILRPGWPSTNGSQLNEFRISLGLKRKSTTLLLHLGLTGAHIPPAYKSFQEWNPRKEIWVRILSNAHLPLLRSLQEAAQKLYESIDRLELYPGLQAEETKLPGPGAGLCPG